MTATLVIDGSHGEGGGQVLRTALSLAALTGRRLRIEHIRAGRPKPGLRPQHLTAVRAVAALCDATLTGDALDSQSLEFAPGCPPRAGTYAFDVGAARPGGSAGATGLVLQAVVPPLLRAAGASRVTVRGGTHVPWSPPADYIADVWLPMLARMGLVSRLEIGKVGWLPAGGGEVTVEIEGKGGEALAPLLALEPGALQVIRGRALVSGVPEHVARRMIERASARLAETGVAIDLKHVIVPALNAGAGLFLHAVFERVTGGYAALGRRGLPAEAVADGAVDALLAHLASGAAMERHLADQLLLPAALAHGPSAFSVERVTSHLESNAWVIEQFDIAEIELTRHDDGTGEARVRPKALARLA